MVDDEALDAWFCREVLPLERALTRYIRRNWRASDDVTDVLHEIYERVLLGAREGLPANAPGYVYAAARNHLINRTKRERIVSFDLVADLETVGAHVDWSATERQLTARDELRRTQQGLDNLSPRCRQVVQLRKIEGLSTQETADRLGLAKDTVDRHLSMGMRALVDFMLGGSGKIDRAKPPRRQRGSDAQ